MKRPCEMSREELLAHKAGLVRAWLKKNPAKALEYSRRGAAKRAEWAIKNKERRAISLKHWRAKNREIINKKQAEYAQKNKARTREYTYKWRAKNKERFRSKLRAYTQTHRERLSEYRKEHRHAHPERTAQVRRAWYERNKGKSNARSAIRRTKTNGNHIENSALIQQFYQTAKRRKSNVCYYCSHRFTEPPDIDHIVPLSKGGKHAIENLCVSCESCNCSKRDKLVTEWKRAGQQVLAV